MEVRHRAGERNLDAGVQMVGELVQIRADASEARVGLAVDGWDETDGPGKAGSDKVGGDRFSCKSSPDTNANGLRGRGVDTRQRITLVRRIVPGGLAVLRDDFAWSFDGSLSLSPVRITPWRDLEARLGAPRFSGCISQTVEHSLHCRYFLGESAFDQLDNPGDELALGKPRGEGGRRRGPRPELECPMKWFNWPRDGVEKSEEIR